MEYLDVVDKYGNPTGETVERDTAHALGIPHRSSHLWLLRKKGGKIQVLLQKRSYEKDSFPGLFDISSAGHMPAGCGYEESALREANEELGITIDERNLIYCGDRICTWDNVFNGKPFHDRQYGRVFMTWYDAEESDFNIQKEELDSVLWMDLDECIRSVKENLFEHCLILEELEMLVSAIDKQD